jgi:hypothetical protein
VNRNLNLEIQSDITAHEDHREIPKENSRSVRWCERICYNKKNFVEQISAESPFLGIK